MTGRLDPGDTARIRFYLPEEEPFRIVGIRISSGADAVNAPLALDTHGEFYGDTPFQVSHEEQAGRVWRLTLLDVRAAERVFESSWSYALGIEGEKGGQHWLMPRIYNEGDGPGGGQRG